MSTTISSTGVTKWANRIPTITAQNALMFLRANLMYFRAVYNNANIDELTGPGGFSVGQTLNIPLPLSAPTVQDKAEYTSLTLLQPTPSKVALTLNKDKYLQIEPEAVLRALANNDPATAHRSELVYYLVKQLDSDVASLYSDVSTYSVGVGGTDVVPDRIADAMRYLDDAAVPDDGERYLFLSPKDTVSILKHPDFAPYFQRSQMDSIRTGTIGEMMTFKVVKTSQVPTSGGTTYNCAFHRSAFGVCVRPYPRPVSNVTWGQVADPEAGLSVATFAAWDGDYHADQIAYKLLYGVKTLAEGRACLVLG